MERFREFDFDGYAYDFDVTPWYICRLMDSREEQSIYISDFLPDFFEGGVDFESGDAVFESVNTDFVLFSINPTYLRSVGYDPEILISLVEFKNKFFSLIKSYSDDLSNARGIFRKKVGYYLNRIAEKLYYGSDLEVSKDVLREVLTLMGKDFDLGNISEIELSLYNSSYTAFSKVLHSLELFNPEEIRNGSFYLKKVPPPNGWDFKIVLQSLSKSISRLHLNVFSIYKRDYRDERWSALMDEAEKIYLLGELICDRVPRVYIKNNKNELWELSTRAFYHDLLRREIKGVFLYFGEDPNFWDFLAIPDHILSSRAVYKPWRRVR